MPAEVAVAAIPLRGARTYAAINVIDCPGGPAISAGGFA
jgi:hypothetical protein